jgi:MraZ protein
VSGFPDDPADGLEAAGSGNASGAGAWDDLQVGFTGNPKAKIDEERGRLKMPAEFKDFIEKKYGKDFNAFYVTSQDGETAEIYPMPEWQKYMGKVLKMPKSHPVRIKLMRLHNYYGARVDMDPQGRLQMPQPLRGEADLHGDVKVSGEGTLLRVTNFDKLSRSVKEDPLTPEDQDTLTGFDL